MEVKLDNKRKTILIIIAVLTLTIGVSHILLLSFKMKEEVMLVLFQIQ